MYKGYSYKYHFIFVAQETIADSKTPLLAGQDAPNAPVVSSRDIPGYFNKLQIIVFHKLTQLMKLIKNKMTHLINVTLRM